MEKYFYYIFTIIYSISEKMETVGWGNIGRYWDTLLQVETASWTTILQIDWKRAIV